jgi:DNA-binding IscR family transcriptional regulator
LLKKPDEVNLAEVVRLFDGAIAFLPCVTFRYYERCDECKDEFTCGIRDAFKDIRDATVTMLKESTLQKIIEREGSLSAALRDQQK